MIAAGLTGGIASGKSTVSRFFAVLGARIIDADLLAREVVEPGQPAYDEILSVFGPSIALADGRLDRLQLGRLVFADPRKRKRLEAIVHPRVFQRSFAILDEIEGHTPDCVAILDIPLLFEAGMDRKLSEIIVVYVPEKLQLERLVRRDGLTRIEAMRRIRSQLPIEDKRRRATMLIDNSGRPEETQRAVRAIYGTLHRRALLFRP